MAYSLAVGSRQPVLLDSCCSPVCWDQDAVICGQLLTVHGSQSLSRLWGVCPAPRNDLPMCAHRLPLTRVSSHTCVDSWSASTVSEASSSPRSPSACRR